MNSVERELWDHGICISFIQLEIFSEWELCAKLRITIIGKGKKFPVLMELQVNVKFVYTTMLNGKERNIVIWDHIIRGFDL